MGSTPSARTARLAGIEGVRAIAALSVLVYHVYYYAAPDGRPVDLGLLTKVADNLRAGVTLFFVLSGFLLYRVFVAAALRDRPMPSVRQYLRNRALRILPAYWVILIGVALVFQHELLTDPAMLAANLLLIQNYVPSYLVGGDEGLGIVPAWSLVIEVSFYLLVPVLGYLAVRLAARRGRGVAAALVPVALMLVGGIAAKVLARGMGPSDALAVWNHALPTHADWFAMGMALAVARVLWEDGRLHVRTGSLVACSLASLTAAAACARLYYQGTITALEQQTANAVLFAVALGFVVLATHEARTVRVLSLRPMVFLGLASYSIFLVHDPMVRGFRDWGITLDGTSGFLVNLALIAGLSIVLASLSYLYVERPALARKRNWQAGDRAGLGSSAPPDGVPAASTASANVHSPALPGVTPRAGSTPPAG